MPFRGSVNVGRFAPRSPVPFGGTRTTYAPRPAAPVSDVGLDGDAADLHAALPRLSAKDQDFAGSLLAGYRKYGSFSEKQAPWVTTLIGRANGAAPAGRPRPARQSVALGDFAPMIALFDNASRPGKRAPKVSLRSGETEIVLSVAGGEAREPGTINVATPGGFGSATWFGRIKRDGAFEMSPRVETSTAVVALLADFARDPLAAMVAYGRLTGSCSICRRKLTDAKSVARGIGPVCAARLGF